VADVVLRLAEDGESHCKLVDPAGGPVTVPIVELSPQTALLGTKLNFMPNDYLDVTLQLRGAAPKAMFAHVVNLEGASLRIRWLHFDPSDEGKLKAFLDAFASGALRPEDKPAAAPQAAAAAPVSGEATNRQGTRRIVRPSTVFTPFSKSGTTPAAGNPVLPPDSAPRPAEGAPERQGTRRVVRPSGPTLQPFSGTVAGTRPTAPAPAPASDNSTVRPAVARPEGPTLKAVDSAGNFAIGSEAAQGSSSSQSDKPVDQKAEEAHSNKIDNPQTTEVASDAKMVVGADGKMDIGATIRSKAKTIRASELAARHDKVRVLNMGTIKLLIQDAVSEAMVHINASIGETEKKRLLEESEAQFQERLKTFQAEKAGAQEYAKQLNEQLRRAQNLLEEERKRTISADQFTVSESGMGQIEDKMKRVLDFAMRTGDVSPELETKLRDMIAHILDEERERIRKQEQEAQGAKIELLEKKLKRLAGNLEETERQRDEAQAIANALEQQGGGLRNIMTAGLADSDGAKKRKLALMKEILDMNRKIREELGVQYNRDDAAVAKLDAEREQLKDGPLPSGNVDKPTGPSAAELAAAAAEAGESDSGAEAVIAEDTPTSGAVEIDPDDMVWEVKPIKVASDEERDAAKAEKKAGIKRFSAGATAAPAPPRTPGG